MPHNHNGIPHDHHGMGGCEYCNLWAKKHRAVVRLNILKLLGNRCNVCGETDLRTLQIHHKNGGGSREREPKGSHTGGKDVARFYEDIATGRRKTDDLELLCANCHMKREYESGARFDFTTVPFRLVKRRKNGVLEDQGVS